MSNTVTASSNRRLLRGTCLALVLTGAVALGSTVSPRPFGYDSWPKPPAPARVQPLVQVRPEAGVPHIDAVVRPVRASAPVAPARAATHARSHARRTRIQSGTARDRTPPAPRGSGRSAEPKQPSKDRGHRHPGAHTPPAGQADAGQPQQPDPAPSSPPTPAVRVAQAAPSTALPPHGHANRGLMVHPIARAQASSGDCPEHEQEGSQPTKDGD